MAINTKPTESLPEIDRRHLPGDDAHGPGEPAPRPRPKAKKRGLIWVIFLLVILGLAGYAVYRVQHPGARQPTNAGGFGGGRRGGGIGPTPAVVSKVGRSSIPVYLNGLGNVTAFYTVTVKSRVDGQVMKMDFNEGDFVKQGQTLIEIDPRPYQVQLELAEATLAHDTALLNNAKLDLERYQMLLATDAIPKQQLDTQMALVR